MAFGLTPIRQQLDDQQTGFGGPAIQRQLQNHFQPAAGGHTTTPGTSGIGAPGTSNSYADQTKGAGTTGSPGNASQEGILSGAGYNEDWYKKYGEDMMGTPSSSEDLYSRGVEGSNPFYDYAQERTVKAINDASAARGNFNSSYTMKTIGNAVADIRGQQAHELGMLAGQADQGKFGRYDRGNEYSRDAQDALEGRVRGAGNAYTDLAGRQADMVGDFYGKAGDHMSKSEMAAIEVMLKESGLKAEEVKAIIDVIGAGGKAIGGAVG